VLQHFGLAKALRSYCAEFSKLKNFHIRWRERNVPGNIPEDIALSLYRVTQEALANAAKHSTAKGASVLLAGAGGRVHLVVTDEGAGFDPSATVEKPGLGLVNIRERVRLIGGTLFIKARPGDGTRIEVSVPSCPRTTMKKPRVILADDHTLVMEGITMLLAGHVDLVGTAEDGRALVNAAVRLQPDVIVLDISMPKLNGIEAARQLRKLVPDAELIFLTQYSDALYVEEALRMGVSGYVLKHSAVAELWAAIKAVQRGQTYITRLLKQVTRKHRLRGEPAASPSLTSREREVLQLVAEGRSMKETVSDLSVSVKTVQFHKANLARKLGLRTTAELTKYAVRRGMTIP